MPTWNLPISQDELRRLYWEEGLTVKAIAPLTGKSEETVHRHMKDWGIPQRSRSQISNQAWRAAGKPALPPKDDLETLYITDKKPLSVVAAHYHVAGITARLWLIHYGIPLRSMSESLKLRGFSGAGNPAWKSGRRETKSGYILIYQPDHPNARQNRCVPEHILLWERAHGQLLPKGWVVHHCDGNRGNNDPVNLVAMTKRDHMKLHHAEQRKVIGLEQLVKALTQKVIALELEIEMVKGQIAERASTYGM